MGHAYTFSHKKRVMTWKVIKGKIMGLIFYEFVYFCLNFIGIIMTILNINHYIILLKLSSDLDHPDKTKKTDEKYS